VIPEPIFNAAGTGSNRALEEKAMLARFLRSGWGIFLLTLVILILGAGSMVGYQIYSVAHPPRVKDPVAPGDLLLRADAVSFQSIDGVTLSAWLVHGDRDAPAIVLCHDLGESKAIFLDAAIPLQKMGYNLLMIDFRGHTRPAAPAGGRTPRCRSWSGRTGCSGSRRRWHRPSCTPSGS
jgi:hypothetical protein